ncbi:MAG: serine protease [Ginsengibacter sp.]
MKHILIISRLTLYTFILIQPTIGQTLSPESIRQRAEKSVAFISGRGGGCTAFFIGKGYLVTAGHCLDVLTADTITILLNGRSVKAKLEGNAKFNLNASSVNASSYRDLAVLRIKYSSDTINYIPLPIASYIMRKDDIIYSYSGQFNQLYNGTIAGYNSLRIVTYNMPICVEGNSGSPYLDSYGNVVGVASFGDGNDTETCVGANIASYLHLYGGIPGVKIIATSPAASLPSQPVSPVVTTPAISASVIKIASASIVSFPKNNSIGCMLNDGFILSRSSDFPRISEKKFTQLPITSQFMKQYFPVRKIIISDSLDLCFIKIEELVNNPSMAIANNYESNVITAFAIPSLNLADVKQATATMGSLYKNIALGILSISINRLSFVFNKDGVLIGLSTSACDGETACPFIDLVAIREKITNTLLRNRNVIHKNK